MRRLALVLAPFALALAPSLARADEAPTRPEQHESDALPPAGVRLPTLLGGLAFTGVWYGGGVALAAGWPDPPGMKQLRVPVAGPWMALAHQGCSVPGDCGFADYVRPFFFVLSGIAQAGGIGVMLESILIPTGQPGATVPRPGPRKTSPDDGPPPDGEPSPQNGKPLFWIPKPMPIGATGWGLGVAGAF